MANVAGPFFGTVRIVSADGKRHEIHVSVYDYDDARKLIQQDQREYVERTYGSGTVLCSIEITNDPTHFGRMIILPEQK